MIIVVIRTREEQIQRIFGIRYKLCLNDIEEFGEKQKHGTVLQI